MPIDIQNLPGQGANGDHRVYSNFYSDEFIIQQTCVVQPKNLLIDVLRRRFKKDTIYTYREDEFGFPLTPDITGSSIDAETTTKILISDSFRYDVKFYPNIVVKFSGGSYQPVSFNQNGTVKYRKDLLTDDFGNQSVISTPTHRVYAGAWDLNLDVVVSAESYSELQRLIDIISMELQYSSWNELRANGLFIKSMSISAESQEPYANDYVYNMSLSLSTRSEWRVEIPINDLIEKMVFYFDFARTPISPNANIADFQSLKYDDVIEFAEIDLTS